MVKGLYYGGIGVFELGVFSAYGDRNLCFGVPDIADELFPFPQVWGAVDVELFVDDFRQAFLLEYKRGFVNVLHVQSCDYRILVDIAEIGNLCLDLLCQELGAPSNDDIRENSPLLQECYALLGRFGFLFIDAIGDGDIGQVHIDNVFSPHILPHLPHGLQEKLIFNVTHGTADFNDHQIGLLALGNLKYVALYDIRYVRYVLNGLSKVVSPPLLLPDHVEYLAHGHIPV